MDRRTRRFFAVGLLVTLIVAVAISQVASSDPDGLEYVAEQEGFADAARDHDLGDTALADYGEGLTGNRVADTALAGLIGVLATLGVGWVVFRLIRRRDEDPAST
jgi:hypothetical protein